MKCAVTHAAGSSDESGEQLVSDIKEDFRIFPPWFFFLSLWLSSFAAPLDISLGFETGSVV
jgi:hypothetical protein